MLHLLARTLQFSSRLGNSLRALLHACMLVYFSIDIDVSEVDTGKRVSVFQIQQIVSPG